MREALKNISGVRQRFIATFERYGTKKAFKGAPIKTLLFRNVRTKEGRTLCDHIWFVTCKGFEKYEFEDGQYVSFDARVKTYTKGYKGSNKNWDDNFDIKPISRDYKLSHPNNIVLQENKATAQLSFL